MRLEITMMIYELLNWQVLTVLRSSLTIYSLLMDVSLQRKIYCLPLYIILYPLLCIYGSQLPQPNYIFANERLTTIKHLSILISNYAMV